MHGETGPPDFEPPPSFRVRFGLLQPVKDACEFPVVPGTGSPSDSTGFSFTEEFNGMLDEQEVAPPFPILESAWIEAGQ